MGKFFKKPIITPWLMYRQHFFLNVIVDISLLIIFISQVELEFINLLNCTLFIIGWISISYLFGRYSKTSDINQFLKEIKKVTYSFFVFITLLTVFFILGFSNLDFTSLILLMKKIVIFAIFSGFFQYLNGLIFQFFVSRNEKWLILTSSQRFRLIKKMIKDFSKNRNLKIDKFHNQFPENFKDYSGIVFDFYDYDSQPSYNSLYLIAKKLGLRCCTISDWSELYFQMIPNEFMDNDLIEDLLINSKKRKYSQLFKRTGDLIFSLFLIFISMPIILIAAILTFLYDGLPIFYKQTRSGFMNKEINIYKIRTMKKDSELNGPQWSKPNDGRITKIGQILRFARIDELPQLFSVIIGDMSLIGPRPERPLIDKKLEKNIKYYNNRYILKPGISGWSQVNYPYGASIRDSKIKLSYDLFYTKHFSVWLDLLILLKTIKVVLTGEGSKPREHLD